jgi:hypothetical protein
LHDALVRFAKQVLAAFASKAVSILRSELHDLGTKPELFQKANAKTSNGIFHSQNVQ